MYYSTTYYLGNEVTDNLFLMDIDSVSVHVYEVKGGFKFKISGFEDLFISLNDLIIGLRDIINTEEITSLCIKGFRSNSRLLHNDIELIFEYDEKSNFYSVLICNDFGDSETVICSRHMIAAMFNHIKEDAETLLNMVLSSNGNYIFKKKTIKDMLAAQNLYIIMTQVLCSLLCLSGNLVISIIAILIIIILGVCIFRTNKIANK